MLEVLDMVKKISKKSIKKLARGSPKKDYYSRTGVRVKKSLISTGIKYENADAPRICWTEETTEEEITAHFEAEIANDKWGLTYLETLFATEFVYNGFKSLVAYRKAVSVQDEDGEVTTNMSNRTMSRHARKLLNKPNVVAFINDQINARCERLEITKDWIARKYKYWSEIDVSKYIKIVKPKDKRQKPFIALKTDLNKMPAMMRSSIKSISMSNQGDIKVEFIDQKSALDSLCKLTGYMNEKLQISNEDNKTIKIVIDQQDMEA